MIVTGIGAVLLKADMNFSDWTKLNYSKSEYMEARTVENLTKEQIQEYKDKGYSVKTYPTLKNLRMKYPEKGKPTIEEKNEGKFNALICKRPPTLNEDCFLFKLVYVAERAGYEGVKAYLHQQRYTIEKEKLEIPQIIPCMMGDGQCTMFCERMCEGKCAVDAADKDRWLALVEKYHIDDYQTSSYKRGKRGF